MICVIGMVILVALVAAVIAQTKFNDKLIEDLKADIDRLESRL